MNTKKNIKEKNKKEISISSSNSSKKSKNSKKHKIPDYMKLNILPEGRIKSYSYYSHKGKSFEGFQKINLDSYLILQNFNNNKDFNIFCIMDGHGPDGHFVSSFISKYLSSYFKTNKKLNSPETKNNLDFIYYKIQKHDYSLLKDAFHSAEDALYKNKKIDTNFSGTSCIILIQIGERIICANVGDSRAFMVKSYDRIISLSIDQRPELPEESNRILKNGGEIIQLEENDGQLGPFRIWEKGKKYPGISISRSIGDSVATKLGVISTPIIIEKFLDKETEFIVIASKGILEVLSNKNILDLVMLFYLKNDPKGACQLIFYEAYKFWSMEEMIVDDLTIIVIFL